jgi:hypothetical protein
MDQFLMLGTILGAVLGAFHAPIVYRQRIVDGDLSPAGAAYFALWAFALWTLFGAYLFAFWLIGAAGMAVSQVTGGRGARA